MTPKGPIRVGMIGCGGIAKACYFTYFESRSAGRLAAVADTDPARTAEWTKRFGVPAFASADDVAKRDDVDALAIATPPFTHLDLVKVAAAHGKHVVIEKPMCRTVAEGREMLDIARKAGIKLHVAYIFRFGPLFTKIKDLLDAGRLGRALSIRLTYLSSIKSHPWLLKKANSGGMLMEQAVHWIDACLWMFGEVESVSAYALTEPLHPGYQPPEESVENHILMTWRHRCGTLGSIVYGWTADYLGAGESGLLGTRGAVNMDGGVNPVVMTYRVEGMEKSETMNVAPSKDKIAWCKTIEPKHQSLDHFFERLSFGRESDMNGEVGLKAVEVIEAAYRSAAEGRTVPLPLP